MKIKFLYNTKKNFMKLILQNKIMILFTIEIDYFVLYLQAKANLELPIYAMYKLTLFHYQ